MGFGWLARGLGFERRHGPFIHERRAGVMLFGNRISLPPVYGRDWRKRVKTPEILRRPFEDPSKLLRNITLTTASQHHALSATARSQFRVFTECPRHFGWGVVSTSFRWRRSGSGQRRQRLYKCGFVSTGYALMRKGECLLKRASLNGIAT
jgi:hypothetical protein